MAGSTPGGSPGISPPRSMRLVTMEVWVSAFPMTAPSATAPPPRPPPETGLGVLNGDHVVLRVQALGLTGGAEVKVHTREALVAGAEDVALTAITHYIVVVSTIAGPMMVMGVVVGVATLLLA